ncbi:hypothetical protein BJY52DRAFT_1190225 [Lactarius psammicola]|nr:hypothetical protein BJY52DRAFT_1190225 [Lactarius psammicola]
MHPSSLPPYPLTNHLEETLAVITLPPSPHVHAGHPRLLAARPLASPYRIDPVAHATHRPRRAQPPSTSSKLVCAHTASAHIADGATQTQKKLPWDPLSTPSPRQYDDDNDEDESSDNAIAGGRRRS